MSLDPVFEQWDAARRLEQAEACPTTRRNERRRDHELDRARSLEREEDRQRKLAASTETDE